MIKEIIAAFAEYKLFTAALIVAVILLVFVLFKAAKASQKSSARRDRLLEQMREDKKIYEEFKALTPAKAAKTEPSRLLHGAGVSVQREIEDAADMEKAFAELSAEKKYAYALNFLFCEDAESLSDFFRRNGKPLTEVADEAVREVIGGELYGLFHSGYCMFDEDNEEVSVIPDEVAKLDEEYKQMFEKLNFDIFSKISDFITNNLRLF